MLLSNQEQLQSSYVSPYSIRDNMKDQHITHSVEEALLLGERLLVLAPRPGRIHREYRLPFADMGVGQDLREVKKHPEFGEKREEILSMIWDMEEEIMGNATEASA